MAGSLEARSTHFKTNSKEFKLREHFTDHPGEWFSEADIQSLRLWEGRPPNGKLQRIVSEVREDLPPPGEIVKILGDPGYVYYQSVTPYHRIEPIGYRPNPISDNSNNPHLYDLFESIRFAMIRDDVRLASSAIPKPQYDLLLLLAQARIRSTGVSTAVASRRLELRSDKVRTLRDKLNESLERLTARDWFAYHPDADFTISLKWDMTYLTYRHEIVEFKAPNGRPNPKSNTKNPTLVL